MKIQWKYLFILLVFSLSPLFLVTAVNQQGLNRLGNIISDDIRNKLHIIEEDCTNIGEPRLSEQVSKRITHYKKHLLLITSIVIILSIFFVSITAYVGSLYANRMLSNIVSIFRRLSKGDFSVRLTLHTGDERDHAIKVFNKMASKLEEHIHLPRTLDIARKVQQSLLPRYVPKIPGLDIAGNSIYCDKIGGDYYDFFKVRNNDENRFAVIVGDVSGHGVSSALLMATARAMIRLRASIPGDISHIITDVNKHLSLDTYETGHFMSLFYCELDMNEKIIRWVRAGHEPAIIYNVDTDDFDELKDRRSLMLGIDKRFEYNEFKSNLVQGQVIVIGTDGIWETQNSAGEMFGMDRFYETIRANASKSAWEIQTAITDTLKAFRGNKKPDDDVTMVIIKVERDE